MDLDAPDFISKAFLPRASTAVVFSCVRNGCDPRAAHLYFAMSKSVA
jgi:hypothetical protein